MINSSITKLDKNFNIKENIIAERVNIKDKTWKLFNVITTDINNFSNKHESLTINSNFDLEKVNNLFSDLSSLTYLELLKLQKDYISIGYSIDDIEIQKHKFYSLPILLVIMTIIGSIIMIYNKFKKNLLLNLFYGILFSVVILLKPFFKSLR